MVTDFKCKCAFCVRSRELREVIKGAKEIGAYEAADTIRELMDKVCELEYDLDYYIMKA